MFELHVPSSVEYRLFADERSIVMQCCVESPLCSASDPAVSN